MALLLFATAWLLDKDIFLEHAVLLTAGTFGRGLAHNIFGSSYFVSGGWCGRLLVVMIACALLQAALPIAFQLRKRYAERSEISRIGRLLAIHRSEQWLFFAPMLLIAVLLAVKMRPGMLTLSWGIEGLIAIMLGLVASQRSYRLPPECRCLLLLVRCQDHCVRCLATGAKGPVYHFHCARRSAHTGFHALWKVSRNDSAASI